jgi:hypothetical protein
MQSSLVTNTERLGEHAYSARPKSTKSHAHYTTFTFFPLTMRLLLTFLTLTGASAFVEGDSCGVKSSDFFNGYFVGDYLVAGAEGCTLGDGQTECYCAPDLTDGQSLSEWKWQCNGVVQFGPAEGKTCPDTIPAPKGYEDLQVVLKQAVEQTPVECNVTQHPGGQQGDEVCPYSDCDAGGDTSAICACIDLAKYNLGEGQQWVCMHSTCSCKAENVTGDETETTTGDETENTTSSAYSMASVTAIILAAASVMLY